MAGGCLSYFISPFVKRPLLRFLLDDHSELSQAAAGLFQQAADGNGKCLLILTDLGVAEAVWVLTSYYKLKRGKRLQRAWPR